MNWFILAVLSALFWGIENFLHKISAKKKLNSSQVSTVFGITACLLGLIFFFIVKEKLINVQYLLFISLMNAILFFSSFITRLEALKKIDASIYFPVSKTGTLFIMIFLSLFFLKETITNLQIVGSL